MTVTQQDDASLTNLSFGQLAKDFNGKANIVKLWVAGFPPMERRQAAYKELQNSTRISKSWSLLARCRRTCRAIPPTRSGQFWRNTRKVKSTLSGAPGRLQPGAYKALKENGRTEIKLYSIDISNRIYS